MRPGDLGEGFFRTARIAVVVDDDVGAFLARRTAMPRPIPLLLPVTSTLRPSRRSLRVPTGAVSVELFI